MIEKILAMIFADVLQLDRVGPNDNFFHIGGQSLLAGQVIARIAETWKVDLPFDLIFSAPTVAQLARHIEARQRRLPGDSIQPGGPVELSFAQERMRFLQDFYSSSLYHLRVFVTLSGPLDIARLEAALSTVVRRHHVLLADGVAILLVPEHDPETSFDLANGPMLRASLVAFSESRFEFMLCVHHIAFDGWSTAILFRELATAYSGGALDPLPLQYSDFANWQRARLTGSVLTGYWREKLHGLKGFLALPTDRPRPPIQTHDAGTYSIPLPDAKPFSRREATTPFITLLTAFQILLFRYTGETDICIGTAVAGRSRKQLEGLIGLFINTIPLRTNLAATGSFREALAAVRQTTVDALAHQELPFEKLIEALPLERSMSHTPVFQVMFTQLDLMPASLHLPGIASGPIEMRNNLTQFDLTANVTSASLIFEYNTGLFDPSTIERMAGHFQTLLAAAMAAPDECISDLPLLTAAEQQQIAVEWNRTEAAIPPDLPLCDVPPLDVPPGTRVGVSMARSNALRETLHAIWKAGAVYVPIDPAYPQERRDFIIEDAAIQVLIADRGMQHLKPLVPAKDELAYIVYTSGSTGKPKGVAVLRSAVINLLEAVRQLTGITDQDVFVAVTTLSFDIAALEMFLPRNVIVATSEQAADGRLLRELIERSAATAMQATPATWRMLIDAGWQGTPHFKILCGGEALPRPLADELLQRAGKVWNLYGPTETTIWSTAALVQAGEGTVPIGRPLANTRVFVLDPRQSLLPIGVPGELYIGGAGLAQGYVNQPEFGRLYRTGDRVKWRPDGQLEFLGRLDGQIKLRGHRIEPGEIEAALLELPGVNTAAVLLDNERLIAFYTGSLENPRAALAQTLPAYMIPSQFVRLQTLPLTANGKLDRNALPKLPAPPTARIAPRDDLERQLAEIWEGVLHHRPIGSNESFFELGGHSLQAAQLVASIEQQLGRRIGLPALFAAPTVEGVARALRNNPGPLAQGIAAIQPNGHLRPFFMVEARSMFWPLARLMAPDRPFLGLHWPKPAEIPEPYRLSDIAAYHVRLMRSRQPRGPYIVGGWCMSAVAAFEIARQLTAQGETVERLFLFDGVNPVVYPKTAVSSPLSLINATRFHLSEMSRLKPAELLPYISKRVKTLKGYTALRQPEKRAVDRENEDFENIETMVAIAVMTYRPEDYNGPAVYFERAENPPLSGNPTYGWGPVMKGQFEMHTIPGKHAEMFQSPNVERLAALIAEHLP